MRERLCHLIHRRVLELRLDPPTFVFSRFGGENIATRETPPGEPGPLRCPADHGSTIAVRRVGAQPLLEKGGGGPRGHNPLRSPTPCAACARVLGP